MGGLERRFGLRDWYGGDFVAVADVDTLVVLGKSLVGTVQGVCLMYLVVVVADVSWGNLLRYGLVGHRNNRPCCLLSQP